MRTRGTKNQLLYRRREAIRLLKNGISCADVAKMLRVNRATVTRWRQRFEKGGHFALYGLNGKVGPKRRLSIDNQKELGRILLEDCIFIECCGYYVASWRLESVRRKVADVMNVSYHRSHFYRMVHDMGCRWSKIHKAWIIPLYIKYNYDE